MKIGLVCPYNMARGGGVQEIVRAMRNELSRKGHTVKILAPQPREGNNYDTDGILFIGGGTDVRSPLHTTAHISVSADGEAIEQILESENFDILHFHEPWVPVLSRQILSRSTSVNIATFHAKVPETLMSRTVVRVVTPYTKSVLKYLHELTAVSESAAQYVKSLTDAPISIIPNGIDLTRYRKPAVSTEGARSPKTILYIGRLERRKGIKYLLKAFALLAREYPDTELLLAGDGPDREKLELMVEDLEIPNVRFLGFVDEETKRNLLQSADLFCSPAVYGESFGIVLLEAMASGLVTVAGDNSGYTALMKDLGALSLVDPHDTPEFARRLSLLLNEPKLRNLWRQWATGYVRQFGYPKVVGQYEALYAAALAHHQKSNAGVRLAA